MLRSSCRRRFIAICQTHFDPQYHLQKHAAQIGQNSNLISTHPGAWCVKLFHPLQLRPCNLCILRRRDSADAHRANHLPADHDREAAFDGRHAGQAEDGISAAGDAVFEFLGRAALGGGCFGFLDRHCGAGGLGVVHHFVIDQGAVVVDDGHRYVQLFLRASASASTPIFLAVSRLAAGPYGGRCACAKAPPAQTTKVTATAANCRKVFRVEVVGMALSFQVENR